MPLDSSSHQTTTPDTEAPELISGSIATNDQDASTGLAAASVQASIKDSGSGLARGSLTYTSNLAPDQQATVWLDRQKLVDGDNNNGQYTSSTTFHENAANGQWSLSYGYIRDEAGKEQFIDATWLADNGIAGLDSFTLESSNPDTADPVLSQVVMGNAVQDAATGVFYIPVSVVASDNLSGIRNGSVRISNSNSGQDAWAWFGGYNGTGKGTAADPFKTTFTLSEYSASGTWSLVNAWLQDQAGNHFNLWDTDLADFLSTSGSASSVVISNRNEDVADPELKGISLVTSTTDDATGRALITIDISIDEQNAGFSHGWIWFSQINGNGSFSTHINHSNLLSGTLHSSGGSYRISALAPEGYSDGDWQISSVELVDAARNHWHSSSSEDSLLQTLKTNGSVVNSFTLAPATGGIPYQEYLSDTEAPEIDASSFSLSYVHDPFRSGKGGRLFVKLRAWDDVSGLNGISLNFESTDGHTYSYNISHASSYLNLSNLSPEHNPSDESLRGDTLNGWFRGSLSIGEYAIGGKWSLTSAHVTDRAGNSTNIYPDRTYIGNGYFDGDTQSSAGFAEWGFDPESLSFDVSNTTPDEQAPDFSGLSLAKATISSEDVDRYGQARLPFSIEIQDDLSGVERIEIEYKGPGGAWAHGWIHTNHVGNESLLTGDSRSGSYTGSISLSNYNRSIQEGSYELASVSIVDRGGNRTTYRDETLSGGGYFDSTIGSDGTDSLTAKLTELDLKASDLAFSYSATTPNNPHPDTAPPVINGIKVWPYQTAKPAAIGLGDQQNALPIRVSATDDSGISNITFNFKNSLDGNSWWTNLWLSPQNMTQGSTIRDGDFEGSIILNEYAQEGRWTLDGLRISDIAGNDQDFWGLQEITDSGAPTQRALDQRAALATLGLDVDALSFVAGDFIEPQTTSVTSGTPITFDVYGMNQLANTTLYWTANIIGSSIKPSGNVSLDALRLGTFTLNTNELGSFNTDTKVFIDLWQDVNKLERVGEATSFTLKAIPALGGGASSPSPTPPAPAQLPAPITPEDPTAQPPAVIAPISEQAKAVLAEIFVNPSAPPTKEQFKEAASAIKDELPSLVASGKISETSAEVIEALASGSVIDSATQSGRKSIPVRFGTDSDDVITGNAGKGVLEGGTGADAFTFIERDRFGKRGNDRITDFNPEEGDKIVISPTAFPGIQNFRFQSIRGRNNLQKALKSDATIIYIEETGQLYYNGTPGKKGSGAGGLFATLNDRPRIGPEAFDFLNLANLAG